MKKLIPLFAILLMTAPAYAYDGTVKTIKLQSITEAELDETVLPVNVAVLNAEDPKDIRIGDGVTVGGIGTYNYQALTNPPGTYDRDLYMKEYSIFLNDGPINTISTGGEGPLIYFRNNGSNSLTIVNGRDETRNALLNIEEVGTDQVKITMLNEEGTTAPVIEYCDVITNVPQVWTVADYTTNRLSVNLIECLTTAPVITNIYYREFRTFRVTAPVVPVRAKFYIPVVAPSFTTTAGDELLTNEPTFLSSAAYGITSGLVDKWNASLSTTGGIVNGSISMADDGTGYGLSQPIKFLTAYTAGAPFYATNFLYAFDSGIIGRTKLKFGNTKMTNPSQENAASTIAFEQSPTFSGIVNYDTNTTNTFIRPDGGKTEIFIDEDSNTRIYVSGSVALTIRPNGVIGIGNNGNDSYLMYGNGQAYFTSGFRGSRFVDMSGGVCDPSDESTLSNLTCSGVTKIILPTSTNGLTSGMLWNDAGTIKVKP